MLRIKYSAGKPRSKIDSLFCESLNRMSLSGCGTIFRHSYPSLFIRFPCNCTINLPRQFTCMSQEQTAQHSREQHWVKPSKQGWTNRAITAYDSRLLEKFTIVMCGTKIPFTSSSSSSSVNVCVSFPRSWLRIKRGCCISWCHLAKAKTKRTFLLTLPPEMWHSHKHTHTHYIHIYMCIKDPG